MRVRMFQKRFAPLVKSGLKRQTIRPTPKRMPKVGDTESWREWTGKPYRSKQRELAVVELESIRSIRITYSHAVVFDHVWAELGSLNAIAKRDGFDSWMDMISWFEANHELPFKGILIEAKDA